MINILIKILKKIVIFYFLLLISPIIVLILRVLSPFLLIRFQHLRVNRIGHLATNIELYLNEQTSKINVPKKKYIDIFYYDRTPCNIILFEICKKKINIFPYYFIKPIELCNNLILGSKKHMIKEGENFHKTHDFFNLLDKQPTHLRLSNSQIKQGEDFLKKIGVHNKKFVCLMVRDNAYLNSKNASYHSHRNCNIENFLLVSEELTKMGYYVFRMGAKVEKKFTSNNPMIIDYASNGMRTELLDIYLCSVCSFGISTSLGIDSLIDVYRKPLLVTNFIPVGDLRFERDKVITIFKHHFSETLNRNLTFKEIANLELGFCFMKKNFIDKKISLIENSDKEILFATKELINMIENKSISSYEQNLINQFNLQFKELYYNNSFNTKIKSTLSGSFLKMNSNFIL